MTTHKELNRDFDSLAKVVLRVKAERDELLKTLQRIAAMDVTNGQAAILARNGAKDAIAKVKEEQP